MLPNEGSAVNRRSISRVPLCGDGLIRKPRPLFTVADRYVFGFRSWQVRIRHTVQDVALQDCIDLATYLIRATVSAQDWLLSYVESGERLTWQR